MKKIESFFLPASGSESTRDTKENDFLTGGERVNGDSLKLIILIEEGDSSVRYNIADSDWSHEEISAAEVRRKG